MPPYRRCLAALAAVAVTATVLLGCAKKPDGPAEALAAFLAGWPTGELDEIAFISPTGDPVASREVADQIAALSGALEPPALTAGAVTTQENLATAEITLDWPLAGEARWTYQRPVRLSRAEEGTWRVIWETKVVHPDLITGDELAVRRARATRGSVLDGAGEPMVRPRPVVVVGIWPAKVTDLEGDVAELDAALRSIDVELDLSGLPDRVAEADENHFVEVVTLRREAYDQIRDRIFPLDGTTFREEERQLAPTRTFARALLGTVDPVTREDMDNNPGVFAIGDQVGHGGLQGRYDEPLRGTPGQTVVIVRKAPDGTPNDIELYRVEPVAGTDLATTLDVGVQEAAEAALRQESKRGAVVVIRVSDGAVLAAANGPDGNPVNLALTGATPPGSTFKMVTAYALLDAGELTLDTVVACPGEFTVEGFTIRNANNAALGDVPFRTDFARSCNTAFASLAPRLGADGLATAAARLGVGGDWDVGIETFTGEVATGGSATQRAAAAFGQGETRVSPVAMAAAAAAIARGAWLPPTLVRAEDAAAPAAVPLEKSTVDSMHEAMRAVITEGTAGALREAPGGPVSGKTGTAEHSGGAHSWFVGWQGDLAFAVFVEDGGSSTRSAVPLALQFLRELNG